MHDREVQVIEHDGECILGFRRGKIDVGIYSLKGDIDEQVEKELNIVLLKKMIYVTELKNCLISMDSVGKEFKMNLIMYLVARFICPAMR